MKLNAKNSPGESEGGGYFGQRPLEEKISWGLPPYVFAKIGVKTLSQSFELPWVPVAKGPYIKREPEPWYVRFPLSIGSVSSASNRIIPCPREEMTLPRVVISSPQRRKERSLLGVVSHKENRPSEEAVLLGVVIEW